MRIFLRRFLLIGKYTVIERRYGAAMDFISIQTAKWWEY